MAERFLYLPSIAFAIAVTALVDRDRQPAEWRPRILASAILLCAVRTIARNPAWQDDQSIAAAGVEAAPRSFRTAPAAGGQSSIHRDPVNHLDDAIREEEAAWSILEPLPPDRIDQQAPAALGYYYRIKGDRTGGPTTAAGPRLVRKIGGHSAARDPPPRRSFKRNSTKASCPRQAAALPSRIREPVHQPRQGACRPGPVRRCPRGFPLRARDQSCATAASMTIWPPFMPPGAISNAAVILLNQKALLFGFSAATSGSLRNLYGHLPDGACAMAEGAPANLGCPRVRTICASPGATWCVSSQPRAWPSGARFPVHHAAKWLSRPGLPVSPACRPVLAVP